MQETILNYEEFPFMIDLRPREFAKANITNDQWFLGLTDEELKILVEGTHDDPYHETWDKLLEVAKFKRNGHEYKLYEDKHEYDLYISPVYDPFLLVDNHFGLGGWKFLFDSIKEHDRWSINLDDDAMAIMETGLDSEYFCETVEQLEAHARFVDQLGRPYCIYQCEGDIWLIPLGFIPDEI